MMDWNKFYTHILKYLKENLPPFLTYHHIQHTLHVLEMSEYIARKEHVSEYDILLLKTAALLHDSGFTKQQHGHEDEGIKLAVEMLPDFGYTANELLIVSNLIRATAIPQRPQNILECILADAYLEYLGTDNFERIGNSLYEELKYHNSNLTKQDWIDIQINFLQSHHYHTEYCIKNRTPKKMEHLNKLINAQQFSKRNQSGAE
jgi:hypothetical protein